MKPKAHKVAAGAIRFSFDLPPASVTHVSADGTVTHTSGVSGESTVFNTDPKKVVLIDGGVKRNIMRSLTARNCDITVLPIDATAEDVLAFKPDGVMWSPGPGDPQVQNAQVEETRKLIGTVPLFGICLGHQVIARALGAGTFKLPFGHRGANHPVRDERTGAVTITAQNHGYAVDPEGLAASAEVSHVNLNDGTVEGLAMRDEPVMTIQYHSEASPGPLDSMGIFDRFVEMMDNAGGSTMTRTTDMQPATVADAAAVASIAHALREEPNTSLPTDLDTDMARAWLTRIAASGAAAIALDGSIPVAFGAVEPSADEPETGELGVWVLPDHRRRGIATELAEELPGARARSRLPAHPRAVAGRQRARPQLPLGHRGDGSPAQPRHDLRAAPLSGRCEKRSPPPAAHTGRLHLAGRARARSRKLGRLLDRACRDGVDYGRPDPRCYVRRRERGR